MQQKDMFSPQTQRVRLLEDEPKAGAKPVAEEVVELVGIRCFPNQVSEPRRYPMGMLTEWFDGRTSVPTRDGFYEISAVNSVMMAWFSKERNLFILADAQYVVAGVHRFSWRGTQELVGRARRQLLE